MKVLHVTDAWAAGVAPAVGGWISSCALVDHAVLARGRDGLPLPTMAGVEMFTLPARPLAAARALRRTVRATGAEVVHAHSSRAGVLARVVPTGASVVYTPHGFAFQRTDVSGLMRRLFRLAEWLLARTRATIIACGRYEGELARGLGRPGRVIEVPYAMPDVRRAGGESCEPPAGGGRVVFMGRLAPQKGVEFATAVVAAVRRRRPAVEVLWVGGGGEAEAELLRGAGVTVTGWVDRADALDLLTTADVYVHTAAWEGLPLTVLEALSAGIPVVARTLGPLDELHVPQAATPEEVAALADHVLSPAGRATATTAAAGVQAARPATDEVGRRLAAAYTSARHHSGVSSPRSAASRRASST